MPGGAPSGASVVLGSVRPPRQDAQWHEHDDFSRAVTDAVRESLARWEAMYAEPGELVDFLEAQVEDHELGAFYARVAKLARLRYRPQTPPPVTRTPLPPTRARESRPRRRGARASAGGDDDPEPEPLERLTCPRCRRADELVCVRGLWYCRACFKRSLCIDWARLIWELRQELERWGKAA
jgi:hypothetical protein